MTKKIKPAAEEYDLGIINDAPSLGEAQYAQRIAAGHCSIPENDDPSFTLGVRKALATETHKQNARLAELNDQSNALLIAEQPEASRQQLEVCLQEFGLIGMTAEEFVLSGIDEFNKSLMHACRAGVAFWAAQEALNSDSTPGRTRTMDDLIEESGIAKPRVYEAIRLAKFYSRLPEESRAKALTIGKKHALLLASLPQEVIDRAAESGNDLIEKADLMTVAELREEVRSLKRREKNYEAEIERAQHQVKRLSEAKKRTTAFLLRTEEMREECMALQLGAELHMNSLQKLFDEVNSEDPDQPEWQLQIEQIWITAHVVAARALDVLERMKDTVKVGDMPERVQGQHILSAEEAERWLLDFPMIENRHAAEKAARQEKRDAAKPKGPGRPKGSASKTDGA